MKLDNKDLKIIGLLKEDARLSIRDIAKKLTLRPSTVHVRIKKLKEQKVWAHLHLAILEGILGLETVCMTV